MTKPEKVLALNILRNQIHRWWHLALAVAILVSGALVEGYWSLRWGRGDADLSLNPLAQAVEQVPLTFQSWRADEPQPPDPRVVEISGARAFFQATYRDAIQGDAVTVYLLGGWSRDISVHTPDACYPGAGFVMETSPQPFVFSYSGQAEAGPTSGTTGSLRQAEFLTAVFTKTEPTGVTRVRVFWSWNDGRGWKAPEFPRWTYGGRRPLVKLYLVGDSPPNKLPHENPALRLAGQLLPALDTQLEKAFTIQTASSPPQN